MTNQNLHHFYDQNQQTASRPLTPREIVKKQITNFHYHVTEEDLDRMIITDKLSIHERAEIRLESRSLSKQPSNDSYEVLDKS